MGGSKRKKEGEIMGTAVVLVVLIGMVAFVIRSMIKEKRAGKSLSCGKNCGACAGCGGNYNIDQEEKNE